MGVKPEGVALIGANDLEYGEPSHRGPVEYGTGSVVAVKGRAVDEYPHRAEPTRAAGTDLPVA